MRVIFSKEVEEMGNIVEPYLELKGVESVLKEDTPPEIIDLYDRYVKKLGEEMDAATM